ncbi:MAG: glycerophosphodiester phosphodiesterase [Burkholderiaceae bacterium]
MPDDHRAHHAHHALRGRRALRLLPAWALAALTLGCLSPLDLQGHRGARGLAPENTLAAFDAALALGVSTLELDTVLTLDNVVVISHDATLNPNLTRDAAGRFIDAPGPAIRSLSLAELRRFDVGRLKADSRYARNWPEQRAADGQRVPSLAELFELVQERGAAHVRFNIETKISPLKPQLTPEPEAFVRAILDVAQSHGMTHRITLQSFDWRTLAVAQRLAPQVPTAYLTAQQAWANNLADARWTAGLTLAEHGSAPRMVKAAGGTIWSPYHGDLDAPLRRTAQALGLKVVVWTVNEAADIEKMLDLGVDGIISDRPDRVRAALAARGWPLPQPVPKTRP